MTSAADLLALQDIDLRRDARRAQMADIDSRLVETEELLAARESLVTAEAEVERLRREQRELDDQAQDLDARIGPLETKLYSGAIHNPKELTDLQREVDSFKTRRAVLDDAGLRLIEELEAATRAATENREELARQEAYWQADQEEMRADRARAEQDMAVLDAERGRWTVSMDAGALGLYEMLRVKKSGRAVARLERNSCNGCRLTPPTHIAQRVRAGTVLVQCPSCERILVGA